jgi:Acetyltransferase (GNAT) domain
VSITIHNFDASDAEKWDAFCKITHQGTFLHTRRFLSYHGNRFKDLSLVLKRDDAIVALLPAAEKPGDSETVVSHPGITYGGLLHAGKVMGEDTIEVFQSVMTHYSQLGYKRFIYKAVPSIYHQAPSDDDHYAMFRIGASRTRSDLSCAINLANRLALSSRRKRSLVKAHKAGITVESGPHLLEGLWSVLKKNLRSKHNAVPVHTLAEITLLEDLFPENIKATCAIVGGEVVAGVVTFETPTCVHAQYIASSESGYEISALDLVFEHLISNAAATKKQWFDFGISNEQEGKVLNVGLYNFKSEFGGGGIKHDFYQINMHAS